MKRTEKIALLLRMRDGVSSDLLAAKPNQINEFLALGLLRQSNGSYALTRKGKALADSVAEAFL